MDFNLSSKIIQLFRSIEIVLSQCLVLFLFVTLKPLMIILCYRWIQACPSPTIFFLVSSFDAVCFRLVKKSYCQEEGEEVGDGRAEGSSATGDGGQAAVSLTHTIMNFSSESILLMNK